QADGWQKPVATRRMTVEELKREWQFFRAVALAERLLQAGLISREEYRAVMAENIKIFSPKLGKLYDF
ncbi:MAG: hypothetical protein PUB60_07645, partial [Veillonellaceae bacterium]|nr:hypothetical protein [Veillonellaceae bacterium]